MDFQKLKNQMHEIQKLISKSVSDENPGKAGLEMAKNQAANNLEQLKLLEKSMLKNYSNLYLIVGAKDKILKAFESQGCFVADHMVLARKVAKFFHPQFTPGMTLNSFLLDQMNQYMDTLCKEIGLDVFIRPRMTMDTRYQIEIHSEEQLSDLLEKMFEDQLKNQITDNEGHVLQALMSVDDLMKKYSAVDKVGRNINFVVSVPALTPDVIDAYKNILSTNIFTATFKSKLDLNDEKKVQDAVKSVLKRQEEKEI